MLPVKSSFSPLGAAYCGDAATPSAITRLDDHTRQWQELIPAEVFIVLRSNIMSKPIRTSTAIACLLFLGYSSAALADAIDGDWCHANGKRMSIHGPEIVTPGGKRTQGDYSRHFFSYVVPQDEAGAGENVAITLLGEYHAQSRQGGADAPVQEWRRCQPGVS
jgi:hypothetical protein